MKCFICLRSYVHKKLLKSSYAIAYGYYMSIRLIIDL
nr:MAG TPA: C2H2 type zinc-finger protein [Caudoviricetes sp.]